MHDAHGACARAGGRQVKVKIGIPHGVPDVGDNADIRRGLTRSGCMYYTGT